MAYTSQEIEFMERQYDLLTKQIKMLKADQKKIHNVLRQRKLYEQRIGHKVEDKCQYSKMSSDEKKKYNRERMREYRKRDKEEEQ